MNGESADQGLTRYTISARERFLVALRDHLFDMSRVALPLGEKMYDDPAISERYDTVKYVAGTIGETASTFKSPYEMEFLDYLDRSGATSVLDVGCGAGGFYHLLSSIYPGRFRYLGIDLSHEQVRTARRNFGTALFEVGDISRVGDFSAYDVVHAYSILSFMSCEKQIGTLTRMTASTKVLVDTNFTLPKPNYVPRSSYKRFAADRLTAVSFPYREELPRLRGHSVSVRETKYSGTLLVNRRGADDAVALMSERKGVLQICWKKMFCTPTRALEVSIRPDGWSWEEPPELRQSDKKKIFEIYARKLKRP